MGANAWMIVEDKTVDGLRAVENEYQTECGIGMNDRPNRIICLGRKAR
jgi:hypothetical protein